MSIPNRPLAAAAAAAVLGLTVTAAAAAQATTGTPDTAAAPAAPQAIATAPEETRYVLLDVAGKPLPVRIEKEWRCHEDVAAGTLRLREDGRWRLETTIRETCGDRTEMEQEDDDGRYRADGATLHFLDDHGNRNHSDWSPLGEIDLDELDHGTLGDGETLTARLADGKTVLRFRREGA